MSTWKLEVDWIRCSGHGVCVELAPEAISFDDWGYPLVHSTVSPDSVKAARRACDACPSSALTLVKVSAPVSPKAR